MCDCNLRIVLASVECIFIISISRICCRLSFGIFLFCESIQISSSMCFGTECFITRSTAKWSGSIVYLLGCRQKMKNFPPSTFQHGIDPKNDLAAIFLTSGTVFAYHQGLLARLHKKWDKTTITR